MLLRLLVEGCNYLLLQEDLLLFVSLHGIQFSVREDVLHHLLGKIE